MGSYKTKDRICVLLDLDGTTINNDASVFNDVLFDTLKEFGITDICIITNMSSNQIRLDLNTKLKQSEEKYTRFKIIKKLRKLGFLVHNVLTPGDIAHGKLGAYYVEWAKAYFALDRDRKLTLVDLEGQSEKGIRINETINQLEATVARYHRRTDRLALRAAKKAKKNHEDEQAARLKVYQARYEHKGRLFSMIQTPREGKQGLSDSTTFSSFIAIDDRPEELRFIEEANKKADGSDRFPLTTLEILKKLTDDDNIHGDIPCTLKEKQDTDATRIASIKQRYRTKLYEHFVKLSEPHRKNKPQQTIQVCANLRQSIADLANEYLQHLRTANRKKVASLVNQIDFILMNNPPNTNTLRSAVRLLENAFQNEYIGYTKWRFFSKPSDFMDELSKRNSNNFQYPRLLGLLLKKYYVDCHKLNIPINQWLETKVSTLQPESTRSPEALSSVCVIGRPGIR